MLLYYFYPESYGSEAFVMAESLEDAYKALKATKEDDPRSAEYHADMVSEMVTSGRVKVFEAGEVVFTEIS